MEFTTFVRKPFTVEAVEITEENIAEVAEQIGELRSKPDGGSFIHVNRKLVPNVFRVYPGFFMTQMGDNVRVYSRRIFKEQFVEVAPDIQGWIDFINGPDEMPVPASEVEEEVVATP